MKVRELVEALRRWNPEADVLVPSPRPKVLHEDCRYVQGWSTAVHSELHEQRGIEADYVYLHG